MSEDNKDQTQPLETEPLTSSMMRKTSSVPLRKETVRVTLKSVPTGALGNPPSAVPRPGAPKPATMTKDTAPQSSAQRMGSNPNIPDVTSAVPLKQETMRVTLKADPTSQTSIKPSQPGDSAVKKSSVPSAPAVTMKQPVAGASTASKASSHPNIPDVTSAVPLKKETMAITLKADPTAQTAIKPAVPQMPASKAPAAPSVGAAKAPAAKAPAAPSMGTAKAPAAKAPAAPSVGAAKAPAAKAPAAPSVGAAKAPAAPVLSVPKAPGVVAAPKMASPAPTIALNTTAVATPTRPLGAATVSQPLPQATVQLEKTQQLKKPDAPNAVASFQVNATEEEEVDVGAEKAILYLVAACFALSLFVLFAQFQQASVWVDEHKGGDMGAIFSD